MFHQNMYHNNNVNMHTHEVRRVGMLMFIECTRIMYVCTDTQTCDAWCALLLACVTRLTVRQGHAG